MIVGPKLLRPPLLPVLPALLSFLAVALTLVGINALVYVAHRNVSEARPLPSQGSRGVAPAVVFFAPGGSPTAAVVAELNLARRTVHVQAYSFTSAPIAKALVAAEKRGVEVEAILDKSNQTAQYSAADFLAHEGVPTFIDAKHAIAHNKIMIIDGGIVLTGSFNFTKAAEEKNAENLLVLHNPELAAKYEANWRAHFVHSQRYPGR